MPHQCVRCGALYPDASSELLKGCSCGAKLFFYIRQGAEERVKKLLRDLSDNERKQIEKDAFDIIGLDEVDAPVILDLESVNVLEPGKFEVDLVKLFNGDPLVYKLEEGKYVVDVAETFQNMKKRNDVKY